MGSALTAYAAGTGNWDGVVTAFVDGWAKPNTSWLTAKHPDQAYLIRTEQGGGRRSSPASPVYCQPLRHIGGTSCKKPSARYWPVFVLPTLHRVHHRLYLALYLGHLSVVLASSPPSATTTFVGIENYVRAFQDSTLPARLRLYRGVHCSIHRAHQRHAPLPLRWRSPAASRGTNIFRTVFFMPNLIGGIVLGYIWQILLNGVLANLQKPLHRPRCHGSASGGLVILMCWQQIGYMMIIYIAGLQSRARRPDRGRQDRRRQRHGEIAVARSRFPW